MHHVEQHRSVLAGVEARTLVTDAQFPRHFHDQLGFGVMTIGGHRSWSGIGTVEACAGDLITVNAGECHDGIPLGGQPRGWRMLYMEPARVVSLLGEDLRGFPEIRGPVLNEDRLAGQFDTLFSLLSGGRPDPVAAEERLLPVLMSLRQRHCAPRADCDGPMPGVRRAIDRIESDPANPASLAELASLCGLSRFQLLRGFARATGITPHAYAVQQRLLLVRRLLARGVAPSQAALEAGFADQSHMTRAFKRQFGVPPNRYRTAVR
ncbi:MAG: AraC family transcriptional regulator [Paludibaculum sp.]